jgi:hypothetical protein
VPVPRTRGGGDDRSHRAARHPRAFAAAGAAHRARRAAAGRAPYGVDVCFTNPAGVDVASDRFDAEDHLEGLASLAQLGVTWVQVGLPGDSLGHAVEVAQRYGETVIAQAG